MPHFPLKVLGTSGYPKAHTSTSCVKLIGSLTEGLQHGSYWWDYSHDSTGVFLEAFPKLEMPKQNSTDVVLHSFPHNNPDIRGKLNLSSNIATLQCNISVSALNKDSC